MLKAYLATLLSRNANYKSYFKGILEHIFYWSIIKYEEQIDLHTHVHRHTHAHLDTYSDRWGYAYRNTQAHSQKHKGVCNQLCCAAPLN